MDRNLDILVGSAAASELRRKNEVVPIVSTLLQSVFTSYNRDQESAAFIDNHTQRHVSDVAEMRADVNGAIDKFEAAIQEIIVTRQQDEIQSRRWITVVGVVIVLLVVGNAVTPFVTNNSSTPWITTLLSGLSVTGLLYLLYSPVHKLIDMARERSGLIVLPATYRIRVLSASTTEELGGIAKELFELLQKPTFVREKSF